MKVTVEYLCLNCGVINFDAESFSCKACSEVHNPLANKELFAYANRAVHYGYMYRAEYESQVKTQGRVSAKYSLLDPSTYLEWLAVAILSGVAGNLVYDIAKKVAMQIRDRLSTKADLTDQESEVVKIISDNASLNRFAVYVLQYYKGVARLDKEAKGAIIEEEIVHAILDGNSAEAQNAILSITNDKEGMEALRELILAGAKIAAKKRKEKPKLDELSIILKTLKAELKEQKKVKRKNKVKKKKKGK